MNEPRFVVRTIREGKVRILGHDYVPIGLPTLPEHEGQRAAFALYWGPPNFERYDARGLMASVSLWGSEAAFNYQDGPLTPDLWPGPFCEDGTFKWEWWDRIGSPAAAAQLQGDER